MMKVLIVSNDRALLRHLSRFLATFGYETTQVADCQRAAGIADSLSADLLLIDADSDFTAALALCRTVCERDRQSGHYVLLMADENSPDKLLEAVEAGADDFLAKPVVYGEVLMRLRAGARAVEFQRRTRQQRRREPVTGLLTRAAFQARLQAAGVSRASRNGQLACLSIDVDFVDLLARQFGRQVEQNLLGELGRLLDRVCDNDRAELAHFGDGQFAVLLPGVPGQEALRWAEDVRREIAALEFRAGETKLALTVSIGVGSAESVTASPEAVFEKSRQALKTAKASGRDCVVQANQFADEEAAWKELAAPGRLFERTVARDVMMPCTVKLRAADSICSAESLFRQTHLPSIVVVDDRQRFAGIVSAEGVAEHLQAGGDPEQPVSKIATRSVDTVEESLAFADLMSQVAMSDLELVVVADKDRPTGLVSAASLASLSLAPEPPTFCTETPSMRSSYLQIADPFDLCSATDTV